MKSYYRNVLFIAFLLAILTGCSFTIPIRSDMIQSEVNSSATSYRIAKKIILIIPNDTMTQVTDKKPNSFTGSNANWLIPIGQMLSETCYQYFSKLCAEPVQILPESPQSIPTDHDYIVVEPRIKNFEWELNQSKNLGFAITPQARIELELIEHGNAAKTIEGTYDSGFIDGESYAMATKSGVQNRISKVIFRAILMDLEQAAAKIPKKKDLQEAS